MEKFYAALLAASDNILWIIFLANVLRTKQLDNNKSLEVLVIITNIR